MRRRFLLLAAAALAIGAGVLVYRGPGRAIVRGHGGDVAATMLLYALLGLAWRTWPAWRAVATMTIATAIELGQTWWHATSFAGELLIGGTFDGADFIAYALGTLLGLAVEVSRRTVARAPGPGRESQGSCREKYRPAGPRRCDGDATAASRRAAAAPR